MEDIFNPKTYFLLKIVHRSYQTDVDDDCRLKIGFVAAEFLYSFALPIQLSGLELLTHFNRKYEGNKDDLAFIKIMLETTECLDSITNFYLNCLPELIDENSILQTGVEYSLFADRPIKQCGLLYAIINNSICWFKLLETSQIKILLNSIRMYQLNSNQKAIGDSGLRSKIMSHPSIQDLQSDIEYFNDLQLKLDTNPDPLSMISSTKTNINSLFYFELLTARKHYENSDLQIAEQRKILIIIQNSTNA